MSQSETFDTFLIGYTARHDNAVNRWSVFVGDQVLMAGLLLGPLLRRPALLATAVVAGSAVIVGGHLVFERNLDEELTAFRRHPLWTVRADLLLIGGTWRRLASRTGMERTPDGPA